MRGVKKSFGAVQAVNGVDLNIIEGEVTALVGDNGAGKSSLIKTISGLWEPDQGEIFWEGKPVRLRSPKDSEALGITTIYQDLALCDNLDIVQNMFLGHEVLRHFTLDEGSMEITAKRILAELEVTTVRSVRQPVASLSGGQRQSVAVAKAVMSNAKLVIMDEPTAALGVSQTAQVLALIKRLAEGGIDRLDDLAQPQRRLRGGRPDRHPAPGPHCGAGARRRIRQLGGRRLHDDRPIGASPRRQREWERERTMTIDPGGNADSPAAGVGDEVRADARLLLPTADAVHDGAPPRGNAGGRRPRRRGARNPGRLAG